MTATIFPKKLQPGAAIGVFASSRRWPKDEWAQIRAEFEALGHPLVIHPQCALKNFQHAGTGADAAAALHDLLTDNTVGAVMSARGGNGAMRLLPHIDWALVAKAAKPIVGYSDPTGLLDAVMAKTGLLTFHATSARDSLHYHDLPSATRTRKQCLNVLYGTQADLLPAEFASDIMVLQPGTTEGRLIGGNVTSMCHLLGTPYAPDPTGAILLLEDVSCYLYDLDRKLMQLKYAGWLDKVNGIVLGAYKECEDPADAANPYGRTFEQIVLDNLGGRDIPVIANTPFAHVPGAGTWPIGATARLVANDDGVELALTRPAVEA